MPVNNNNQRRNQSHNKLIFELVLMLWRENRGMSNIQKLVCLRSLYLLSLIIADNTVQNSYNYMTKNIPIPSERNYKLQLVEKIKIFIKRMRWKAITYDTGCKQNENVEKYGLKTLHSPK